MIPFLSLRLSGFYIIFFIVGGISLPFWPVWLASKGLDKDQIGLALAIPAWMRVVGSLFWARMAPYYPSYRLLLANLAILSLLSYGLFAIVASVWWVMAVSALCAFFFTPISPFSDYLTLHYAKSHSLDYGRIRLWGSLSFMMTAFCSGWALKGQDPNFILYAILLALTLLIGMSMIVPSPPKLPGRKIRGAIWELLRIRGFLLFLLITCLLQGSHAVLYVCGTLHWQSKGLSDDIIGFLWAEGVVAEIIVFACGKLIFKYINPLQAFMIAGLSVIIRWTVYSATTDLTYLVPLQLFHGITFGLSHLAAMRFLTHYVPTAQAMNGQAIYAGVSTGLTMGIALLGAGWLYKIWFSDAFLLMAVMGVMALIFLSLLHQRLIPKISNYFIVKE